MSINKLQKRMMEELAEGDKNLQARLIKELDQTFAELEKRIRSPASIEELLTLTHPRPGRIGKLLIDHIESILAAGQAHGDKLVEATLKEIAPQKLADWQPSVIKLSPIVINPTLFWLKPREALRALLARELLLADDMDAKLMAEAKKILVDNLEGVAKDETFERMLRLFEGNVARAELVVVTETTYAYNRGRLVAFNSAGVDYIEFSAVMDLRTSNQCSTRHGKIMRLDSPDLADNTPPLHGRCRSVLLPIFGAYQEDLLTEDALDWTEVVPIAESWKN
jgi:phage putative head morphogenesis protein, SPP1 gp7 family